MFIYTAWERSTQHLRKFRVSVTAGENGTRFALWSKKNNIEPTIQSDNTIQYRRVTNYIVQCSAAPYMQYTTVCSRVQ